MQNCDDDTSHEGAKIVLYLTDVVAARADVDRTAAGGDGGAVEIRAVLGDGGAASDGD